jgi:hypothetical protein
VGTTAHQGTDYAVFDWTQRVALVFGNEAAGLDGSLDNLLDERVTIPMVGQAESLNVAVSASVLGFEALRHRRSAVPRSDHGRGGTAGAAQPRSTISGVDAPRRNQGERAGADPGTTAPPEPLLDPSPDPESNGSPDA